MATGQVVGSKLDMRVQGEGVAAPFNDFPIEVVLEILKRLPVKAFPACRLVCRSWKDLVDTDNGIGYLLLIEAKKMSRLSKRMIKDAEGPAKQQKKVELAKQKKQVKTLEWKLQNAGLEPVINIQAEREAFVTAAEEVVLVEVRSASRRAAKLFGRVSAPERKVVRQELRAKNKALKQAEQMQKAAKNRNLIKLGLRPSISKSGSESKDSSERTESKKKNEMLPKGYARRCVRECLRELSDDSDRSSRSASAAGVDTEL